MIPVSRLASVNGTQTRPTKFGVSVQWLESVMILALQYDQAKTAVVENELVLASSPQKTGEIFGFNSQLYSAHKKQYDITNGSVKTYLLPISEPADASASTRTLTVSAVPTKSGNYVFRIDGDKISVAVVSTDTVSTIATKITTAINSNNVINIKASATAGVVTLTSTYKALSANFIKVTDANSRLNDDPMPGGMAVTIGAVAGGAGDESTVLADAWDAIIAHPEWKTDVVMPVCNASSLDLATQKIGLPDDGTGKGSGLWFDGDYRPLTNWTAFRGDLNASLALTSGRKEDPDNIIVCSPDGLESDYLIASAVSAFVAMSASSNPATKYEGQNLSLVGPESISSDWTRGVNAYNDIDIAVKGGLTVVHPDSDDNQTLGDVTTPFRPAGIASPAFQFEVNKRKTWNVAKSVKDDKLANKKDVIVQSLEEASRQIKATDVDSETARIVSLVEFWVKYGLIFNGEFTTNNMQVAISDVNPDRIDRAIPIILSGNKRVMSDTILIDRNINLANDVVVVKIG